MKIELVFSITKPLTEIKLNGFSKPSFTDVLQHYKYYILYQNRNISQAVMMRTTRGLLDINEKNRRLVRIRDFYR